MELSLLCDMNVILIMGDNIMANFVLYESTLGSDFLNTDSKNYTNVAHYTNDDVLRFLVLSLIHSLP